MFYKGWWSDQFYHLKIISFVLSAVHSGKNIARIANAVTVTLYSKVTMKM